MICDLLSSLYLHMLSVNSFIFLLAADSIVLRTGFLGTEEFIQIAIWTTGSRASLNSWKPVSKRKDIIKPGF